MLKQLKSIFDFILLQSFYPIIESHFSSIFLQLVFSATKTKYNTYFSPSFIRLYF
jgi:hypothetical protein